MLNVVAPRNLVNRAAVLVGGLGSRTVETLAMNSSIIPGPMASMHAKNQVGCGETKLSFVTAVEIKMNRHAGFAICTYNLHAFHVCQRLHLATEEATMTSLSSKDTVNIMCTKCGAAKASGKRSCCTRGGAWFKKCGNIGDTQFEHTWAEGIQACQGFPISESPPQVMLHQTRLISFPVDATPARNVPRQQTNICCWSGSVTNAANKDPKDCVCSAKLIICICILFITLHLQR